MMRSLRPFVVRRCGPLEYTVRVLAEVAVPVLILLACRYLPQLGWSRQLPADGRMAVAAFLAALAVLDVAFLRIQRKAVVS